MEPTEAHLDRIEGNVAILLLKSNQLVATATISLETMMENMSQAQRTNDELDSLCW